MLLLCVLRLGLAGVVFCGACMGVWGGCSRVEARSRFQLSDGAGFQGYKTNVRKEEEVGRNIAGLLRGDGDREETSFVGSGRKEREGRWTEREEEQAASETSFKYGASERTANVGGGCASVQVRVFTMGTADTPVALATCLTGWWRLIAEDVSDGWEEGSKIQRGPASAGCERGREGWLPRCETQ
ncbi:hypothetical protein BZA05DRAFT_147403 [Tricharina praecox]|uniref:uncharacterized protein n=1 Tax=Tricharina praecox TaxID=43433 RepID=UPI00221F9510|nr:uncharacterized protein BZA05DRAFT_147403 [Tricharina praecox]KAI5845561.1 hypothetical protein BZA05DRAFT_147403 [Tricharina praecox]